MNVLDLIEQPAGELLLADFAFWTQTRAVPEQESGLHGIRVHGFQRIGDDGIQMLAFQLLTGVVEQRFPGLERESYDRLIGPRKLTQRSQQVGGWFKIKPEALLGASDLPGLALLGGAKIRHRRRHEKKIVSRPLISKENLEFLGRSEP